MSLSSNGASNTSSLSHQKAFLTGNPIPFDITRPNRSMTVTSNTLNVSGTVTYWDRPSGTLKVTDLLGTFANNQLITGNTSGANFVIANAIDALTDPQSREMYDNFVIQTEADNYIDLSENNPFGLPS